MGWTGRAFPKELPGQLCWLPTLKKRNQTLKAPHPLGLKLGLPPSSPPAASSPPFLRPRTPNLVGTSAQPATLRGAFIFTTGLPIVNKTQVSSASYSSSFCLETLLHHSSPQPGTG